MSEMTKHFPELAAIADGKASCSISDIKKRPRKNKDPLVEEGSLLSDSTNDKHEKEAATETWKHPLLAQVYSLLPNYKYVEMSRAVSCNNKAKIERMLRMNQADLIQSKAMHECRLLGESGSFMNEGKFINYPACLHGQFCKGMNKHYRYRSQTKNVIWMSYLYPNELARLEENGIHTGEIRPCLLCLRDAALCTEITHRLVDRKSNISSEFKSSTSSSSSSSSDNSGDQDDLLNYMHPCCQIYYNLVDQPQGYHKDFVIISEPGRPLISPIAKPNISLLVAYTSSNSRLMVNQNAIMWKSLILSTPQPGDNIQGF
jgi:hypothetical protein